MGARRVITVMAVIILLYPLAEAVDLDRDIQQLSFDNRIDWEETMDDDTVLLYFYSLF